MRNHITLLLIFFTASLFAQSVPKIKTDLQRNNLKGKVKSLSILDHEGNISSKNEYDTKGLLQKQTAYSYGIPNNYTIYQYNSKGQLNMLVFHFEYEDLPKDHVTIEITPKGITRKHIPEGKSDPTVIEEFDNHGNQVSHTIFKDKEVLTKVTYEYAGDGFYSRMTTEGSMIDNLDILFEKDSHGNPIVVTTTVAGKTTKSHTTYTYDTQGNWKKSVTTSENGKPAITESRNIEYYP